MQAILTSLKNPVWANEEKTQIDCVITTSQFGDEELPFTADKDDVEPHGVAIFNDIVSGMYGVIGEYVVPEETFPTPPSGEIPTSVVE